MRLSPIFSVGAATALGAVAYWASKKRPTNYSDQAATVGPYGSDDGTAKHWDTMDETIDESFPASDPPGNY